MIENTSLPQGLYEWLLSNISCKVPRIMCSVPVRSPLGSVLSPAPSPIRKGV